MKQYFWITAVNIQCHFSYWQYFYKAEILILSDILNSTVYELCLNTTILFLLIELIIHAYQKRVANAWGRINHFSLKISLLLRKTPDRPNYSENYKEFGVIIKSQFRRCYFRLAKYHQKSKWVLNLFVSEKRLSIY